MIASLAAKMVASIKSDWKFDRTSFILMYGVGFLTVAGIVFGIVAAFHSEPLVCTGSQTVHTHTQLVTQVTTINKIVSVSVVPVVSEYCE